MIKRSSFVSIYIVVPETTLASEAHLAEGQIWLEKQETEHRKVSDKPSINWKANSFQTRRQNLEPK
jgi:hypothetical protein